MNKIEELISKLTLQEKASLLSGANFWNTKAIQRLNIPSMLLTDGPHGLRRQAGKADHLGLSNSVPATCFPTAAGLASSWDAELTYKVGSAIAAEAAATGVSVLLGPGLNIVRDPLAGRAFEYFSEDPFVAGTLAAGMVEGIQSRGVAATPKHFAVNSQEHMRMSIDEVVDERALREIYLEGFRRVIQGAQPRVLMTSYNRVNGAYANENTHLLKDILKNEWGYKGIIVTDWGANNDRVLGLKAGSTLEMPSSNGATDLEIVEAVKSGALDEVVINQQVEGMLSLVFDTAAAIKDAPSADYEANHMLAVEASQQSIVLLKNDGAVLPLKPHTKVALIGDFAQAPRYQGAGSSFVNPTRLVSALDAFKSDDSITLVGFEPGFKRTGGKSASMANRAVNLAKEAETVIIFAGLDEVRESEGIDRSSMQLPANQVDLINKVAAVHHSVVVVLAAGGAVELPFADNVTAIVHGFLGGQGVGTALKNILTGKQNPSGKLAVTYPFVYADAPTSSYFPGKELSAEHRESIYVGYRYYETADVAVRYPFGHGLSYTQFAYSDVLVTNDSVSFSITNTGDVAGAEIAQVYVRPLTPKAFRPTRELKGFSKVYLQPGELKRVTIPFDEHTFAHYSLSAAKWMVEAGEYAIEVGASIKDLRLQVSLERTGEVYSQDDQNDALDVYKSGKVKNVSDDAFTALLGRPLPASQWNRKKRPTYQDTVAQLQYGSLRGRAFYGLLKLVRRVLILLNRPNDANTVVFIMNIPFTRLVGFSGGKLKKKDIERLFGLN